MVESTRAKMLREMGIELADDPETWERFKNAAKVVAKHPPVRTKATSAAAKGQQRRRAREREQKQAPQ